MAYSDTSRMPISMAQVVKLFCILLLLANVVHLGIMLALYTVQFDSTLNILGIEEKSFVHSQKIIVDKTMADVVKDLLFFSGQNELRKYINSNAQESVTGIEAEYKEMAFRKKNYDQLRYLNSLGQEIVRVNYHGGRPVAVPKEECQNKFSRYYFAETLQLKKGEIFVSPLDLNVEHGKIEQPLKPIIRMGTPVFDANGDKKGILLVNYLARYFLDHIRNSSREDREPMFLNNRGYFLLHNNPENEWGFMIKGRESCNFASMYPEEWMNMLQQKTGQLHTSKGLFTFVSIYPVKDALKALEAPKEKYVFSKKTSESSDYYWILVSHIPARTLEKEYAAPLKFRMSLLSAGLFVLIAIVCWVLALAIIKRRVYQEYLVTMALSDALTQLPNRKCFFDHLETGIANAGRYGHQLGLLYLDLDGFKEINDSFGHEAGDAVLVEISKRMTDVVRKSDIVARLGGDEFAIILSQVALPEGPLSVSKKLITEINRPIRLPWGTVFVGASIGGAVYPDTSESPEELVKLADQAMYLSKTKGKNSFTLSSSQP